MFAFESQQSQIKWNIFIASMDTSSLICLLVYKAEKLSAYPSICTTNSILTTEAYLNMAFKQN